MTLTPRQQARRLNEHQLKTSAGFYLSTGHRCFAARVRKGVLEVRPWFDEDAWMPLGDATVTDHNGRPIYL